MSRIEEALEKALKTRRKRVSDREPDAPETEPSPEPETEQAREPVGQDQTARHSREVEVRPDQTVVRGNDMGSLVAEEYRKVKEYLTQKAKTDEFRNTVMVTSALVGEGKTVTSVNLAVSLAQEYDHTVLLVDADLRRPTVERLLGKEPGEGLSEVLRGERRIDEVLVRTGVGKLSLIPAGRTVSNPTELLSSQKMQDLVAQLRKRYPDRYVIIDTPPILPFAEARVIAGLVDWVLLVVREEVATLEEIQEALGSLRGEKVLGLVYNAASLTASERRYGYGYYGQPTG